MTAVDKNPTWVVVMLGVSLDVATALWYALPMWLLWGWFVVPLGIVQIGYWHAVGLVAIKYLFGGSTDPETDDLARGLIFVFAWPLVVLGIGFLARLAMALT